MSQAGNLTTSSELNAVDTLTGNDSVKVPATDGNINVVGAGNLTVTGNPSTSTETISLTGISEYDTLTGGANNSLNNVSPGTSGQILTSNGATAQPSYQNPVNLGPLVLLQSQVVTSSTADVVFTNISGYNTYYLYWYNLTIQTNQEYLTMVLSSNNGSSFYTNDYVLLYSAIFINSGNAEQLLYTSTYNYFILNFAGDSDTSLPGFGYSYLYNFGNSTTYKQISVVSSNLDGSNALNFNGTGSLSNGSSAIINALKILASSGNIQTGTFNLYGVLN